MKKRPQSSLCPLCEIDGYFTEVRDVLVGDKPPYTSMSREFGICRNCGEFAVDETRELKKMYVPIQINRKESSFVRFIKFSIMVTFWMLLIFGLIWLFITFFVNPDSFTPSDPCYTATFRMLHPYVCATGG